ncbi:MAG: hypothetical protein PWP65_435 [Clostridia bacterium]|nr:hypothetical protein [Clostridia bacterium]
MNFFRLNLNRREKILLGVLGCLLIFFLTYSFIGRQQLPRYRQLKAEIAAREVRLKKAQQVVASAQALGERQNKWQAEKEVLRRRLALDDTALEGFLKILQPEEEGLQVSELRPGQERREGNLKIQSWQLKLVGFYPSLKLYLKRLETRLPLLQVTSIKVNARPGAPFSSVEADLTLELPVLPGEKGLPAGPVIALPKNVDVFAPPPKGGPAAEGRQAPGTTEGEKSRAAAPALSYTPANTPPASPGKDRPAVPGSLGGPGNGNEPGGRAEKPSYTFPRR